MSTQQRRPTRAERAVFLLKLIACRAELSPRQQRMLDAMALAACGEEPSVERGRALLPLTTLPRARDDTPWLTILSAES